MAAPAPPIQCVKVQIQMYGVEPLYYCYYTVNHCGTRRYVAVVHPMHFSNPRSQQVRVVLLIVVAWLVSALVAGPLPFVNELEGLGAVCTFTSHVFLLVSSVFSFYIPYALCADSLRRTALQPNVLSRFRTEEMINFSY